MDGVNSAKYFTPVGHPESEPSISPPVTHINNLHGTITIITQIYGLVHPPETTLAQLLQLLNLVGLLKGVSLIFIEHFKNK